MIAQRRKREERNLFSIPVSQTFDLKAAANTYTVKQGSILFLTRIIWHIDFSTTQIDLSKFGVDATLTNGIQLKYIKRDLGEPVKAIHDLGQGFMNILPSGVTAAAAD